MHACISTYIHERAWEEETHSTKILPRWLIPDPCRTILIGLLRANTIKEGLDRLLTLLRILQTSWPNTKNHHQTRALRMGCLSGLPFLMEVQPCLGLWKALTVPCWRSNQNLYQFLWEKSYMIQLTKWCILWIIDFSRASVHIIY